MRRVREREKGGDATIDKWAAAYTEMVTVSVCLLYAVSSEYIVMQRTREGNRLRKEVEGKGEDKSQYLESIPCLRELLTEFKERIMVRNKSSPSTFVLS